MSEVKFNDSMELKLMQKMGSDSAIVAAARVSTQGAESQESFDAEDGAGLINFLMKNRHGTPFEHNSLTFYVKAPIFVYREWHRHRVGWSYNEESGRYKQLEPEFYIPGRERNLKQEGKPGHYIFVPGTDEEYALMSEGHKEVCNISYDNYERQLEAGIAKEVARMTLPVNIYSSMYTTFNTRSLMAFLSLRTKHEDSMFPSYPQREIEMCAEIIEAEFAREFPLVYNAFVSNGRVCP